jgi:small-conductance mechanosensitive channel
VNFEVGLTAKSDIAIGVYNTFAENNIEIPFPQVDLHVKDIVTKEQPKKEKQVKTTTETKKDNTDDTPLIDGSI